MGYRNSPAFIQRNIDLILRHFHGYCQIYQDNIVIYLKTLTEHLKHLTKMFSELNKRNILLAPQKSFMGYPSIKLLEQRVDGLGLAIAEDKFIIITKLDFPKTLSNLEYYLGLTGYLKQFIPIYLTVIKLLK